MAEQSISTNVGDLILSEIRDMRADVRRIDVTLATMQASINGLHEDKVSIFKRLDRVEERMDGMISNELIRKSSWSGPQKLFAAIVSTAAGVAAVGSVGHYLFLLGVFTIGD